MVDIEFESISDVIERSKWEKMQILQVLLVF